MGDEDELLPVQGCEWVNTKHSMNVLWLSRVEDWSKYSLHVQLIKAYTWDPDEPPAMMLDVSQIYYN